MSTEQKPVGANQWMVSDAGQQQGPFTLDQLKQTIQDGRLSPAALVWTPGMTEWKAWKEVPELGVQESQSPRPAAAPAPHRSSPLPAMDRSEIVDYLFFRKMITPLIIQIIFWLGIAGVAIGSLTVLVGALASGSVLMILFGLLVSLFAFALGAVTVRVYCELLVVVFRILETLAEIKLQLEKK
jgi:hypothetical protein